MANILLVEDDSNLREIYGARLEAEGYQIFAASDGEEALALAVKERPDLIISDVMMPKISGFDMLDILRTTPETKDVKVIVMTALSQDEDRKRGEELGADRYIVKSQVTLDDVVQMVHDLLGDGVAPAAMASVDPSAATMPTDDDTIQVNEDGALTSAQAAATPGLHEEVADFVANSPLMNGVAPSQQPPTVLNDQPVQQPPANDQL